VIALVYYAVVIRHHSLGTELFAVTVAYVPLSTSHDILCTTHDSGWSIAQLYCMLSRLRAVYIPCGWWVTHATVTDVNPLKPNSSSCYILPYRSNLHF